MTVLIQNKKAHLNYEFLEEFQAGIELFGFEVKSVRDKKGSLDGAYIIIRGNEAFLINAHIPPYQIANTPENYDPYRNRKLLLTKKELVRISEAEGQKGLTIVAISMYNLKRKIKVKIAIARGKKKYDKREDIKAKDTKRFIENQMKQKKWG